MERITERKTSCWIKTKSGKDYTNYTKDWDAISELAAYEDTGLTPEEIRELKERDAARAPEPAPLGMDGMVCPACGKKALPWDRFCGECGQRFWEDE